MNRDKGNVLVFGGYGQLGQCLQAVVGSANERLVFLSSQQANVANEEQLVSLFNHYKPTIVVNCAAYTAVDQAEDEVEQANVLNADAPATIAKLCKQFDVEFIHISTDFVFEGNKTGLLSETDDTKPVGVYGQSKLAGEQAIEQIWEKHFIIRTSWLYAPFGNNFVKTMIRLGKERTQLNVVADQVGTPTYGIDLANVILMFISQPERAYGRYHYSNEGAASWYDFAHAIFEINQLQVKLLPISTSAFPTKAKRPAYSVLDKSKIKQQLAIEIPHWRDSLKRCLNFSQSIE
ncbi:dTDP-4-dehydrorhamnose reductase [Olivibacter ginsenosidimutans]|uniref:dTDP-4-dehydrorhamnose reductase n=1 Tax=Olivibacter ginsenosidimutans TaxID=1176537 RepID=A0ABP9AHA3_9SPHI